MENEIIKIVRKRIEEIVIENFGEEIRENNLFKIEDYIVNSIDALELIILVEREFSIEIEDMDLSSDLVANLDVLVECVVRLQEKNSRSKYGHY